MNFVLRYIILYLFIILWYRTLRYAVVVFSNQEYVVSASLWLIYTKLLKKLLQTCELIQTFHSCYAWRFFHQKWRLMTMNIFHCMLFLKFFNCFPAHNHVLFLEEDLMFVTNQSRINELLTIQLMTVIN